MSYHLYCPALVSEGVPGASHGCWQLPDTVSSALGSLDWGISFGIKGIDGQFACLKWGGYVNRIRFWILAPVLASMVIGLVAVLVVKCRQQAGGASTQPLTPSLKRGTQSMRALPGRLLRNISSSMKALPRRRRLDKGSNAPKWRLPTQPADNPDRAPTVLEMALPPILWLLFFAYPLVTNVAFAAFPCYDLDSGSWLRADVAIKCGSAEHTEAMSLAVVAILLYPIGLLLTSFILLLRAREAIRSKETTPLSKAIAFLWREFKPEYFWWECIELLKRVVLVGLMQLAWYGEVLQVLLGTLLAVSFLLFQLISLPYADPSINFVASISSYCLVVFFLMCVALKYATLTDTYDIAGKMSGAQHDVYTYDTNVLSALLLVSIFASVVVAGIMTLQATLLEVQRVDQVA